MRKVISFGCVVIAMSIALAGCSSRNSSSRSAKLDPFAGTGSPYYKGKGKIPMGGGRYQVGDPYQVAGRWFTPHEQPNYDKTGPASWYGEAFNRRKTSNGEWFDMDQFTAAHPTLPLPSYAKVTNLENGNSIIVRINDRGPFVGPRIMDLSKRSSIALGFKQQGTATVRVQYIGPAPLNDNGSHLMAMNRELSRGTPLRQMIAAAKGRVSQKYAVAQAETADQTEQVAYAQPQEQQFAANPVGVENYFVQVGSFADPDNVERIRQELSGVGQVQITEFTNSNGSVYRVRVGPMESANQAQIVLNQVVGFGLPDAHVIEAPQQQALLQ